MGRDRRTVDGKERKLCDTCRSKGEVPDETKTFKYKICPDCGGKGWLETEPS